MITILVPAACASTPVPQATTAVIPPEVIQYAVDWPLPNKDYANDRATKDATINSENVKDLGVAWAAPLAGQGAYGAASSTPLIMGDTVYFQDLRDNILALDLATGAIKWEKMYHQPNLGPNGVVVGWGKVFGAADPYDIAALDMNSGKQLWESPISSSPFEGNDVQPAIYGGLIFTSTVPGSRAADTYFGGAVGTVEALDQNTGKIAWSWDTVDSEDIWGNKTYNSGGGVRYTPAIDTKTDTMYFGTGNPGPWPPISESPNALTRPGANLYTNSMVAMSLKDGALRWFNQIAPHDQFDYEFQIPPILASANVSGQPQDIVIGAGKMGKVVAFNRQTGSILWETFVGQHQNDQVAEIPADGSTLTVLPGALGGVDTPMAYADGVVYVPVVNLAGDYTTSSYTPHPMSEGSGELVAIEVDTGKILWDKTFKSIDIGGATVVNDLVFTSTFDGMVYAFERDTGEQVWNYRAPGGVSAWPAFAGDTMVLPVGNGAVPALIAFKLGATAPVLAINPGNGSAVNSSNVSVSALAMNIELTDKPGRANVVGEGHLHYFMDADAPTAAGTYAATSAVSHTWENVALGTHTFSVELVNNDDTPLDPPVVARSTIVVQHSPPTIEITAPTPDSKVPSGNVTISVAVSNFKLVDKPGEANVTGEGLLRYFMDVPAPVQRGVPANTYAETSATSYTWQDVGPGPHAFMVELVNNDDTPLDEPAVAEFIVNIAAFGT